MPYKTKIRKIGNSLGIVLPREAIQALHVKEGAAVYLTDAPEASLRLSAENPEFEKKLEAAEDLMHRYRHALRKLAQ
jgi:putative addiction module antidote